ncbi:MAG: hypothetical protein IRZ07_16440, partial [Microbispora sp.]|nr:hypothetical protein [Microbispora sp.]
MMRGEARSFAAARKDRVADIDRWLTDLLRTAATGPYAREGGSGGKGGFPGGGGSSDSSAPASGARGPAGSSGLTPGG